jgi:hypothetical protein
MRNNSPTEYSLGSPSRGPEVVVTERASHSWRGQSALHSGVSKGDAALALRPAAWTGRKPAGTARGGDPRTGCPPPWTNASCRTRRLRDRIESEEDRGATRAGLVPRTDQQSLRMPSHCATSGDACHDGLSDALTGATAAPPPPDRRSAGLTASARPRARLTAPPTQALPIGITAIADDDARSHRVGAGRPIPLG